MGPDQALLQPTEHSLHCAAGDFHVDPWRPVDRAIVTHADADHVCWGCGHYLSSKQGLAVLRARLATDAQLATWSRGVDIETGGVRVSPQANR